MRWAACAVFVLLAGCGQPGPKESDSQTSSTGQFSVVVGGPPPPTTDTLHLLAAPHLAAAAPQAGAAIRTAVPGVLEAQQGGPRGVFWSLDRNGITFLSANVTLWVEVTGTVVNHDGCFWTLVLRISGEAPPEAGTCVVEDTLVASGAHMIQVAIPPLDTASLEGDTIELWVQHSATFVAPDGKVEVLSGTPERDSVLQISRLKAPLDYVSA